MDLDFFQNGTQLPENINYIQDHAHIFVPYFLTNCLGMFFGTIGNILVMLTILSSKNLRNNPVYILIFNLALSDITISIFVHTFTNFGIYYGEVFFQEKSSFCIFIGSICLVSCGTSLFSMAFLALNRYIAICYNTFYKRFFTLRNTLVICTMTWFGGFAIDFPNLIGIGGHFFDKKSANCMWNRLANRLNSLFFAMIAIFIPCILITGCYLRIYLYARKSNKKQHSFRRSLRGSTIKRMKKSNQEILRKKKSIRLALSLFISFGLFAFCWIPYGIVISFGFEDQFPIELHAFVTLMAHINSSLNPYIYLMNNTFRKAFRNLFVKSHLLSTSSARNI